MMQPSGSSWETTKAKLRSCHELLDEQLAELTNIRRVSEDTVTGVRSAGDADDDSLLETQAVKAGDLRVAILELLKKSRQLTDDLADAARGDMTKTLQLKRLREITANYNAEFQQANRNIEEHLTRKRLLASSLPKASTIGRSEGSAAAAAEQQQLLRERSALDSTITVLEQTIAQGRETMAALGGQRSRFNSIARKGKELLQRFPALNSVMTKIQHARTRQSIILASVVGVCLLFILWFAFT